MDASTLAIWQFVLLVASGSVLAGLLGALTGLGGGVVIVPMLVLLFGVDLRYAIGASLVAVIATSSGAAAAYVREGYSNIRLGLFLEIATTVGALTGALIATVASANWIAIIFGVVLLCSAFFSATAAGEPAIPVTSDRFAVWLSLDSTYPDNGQLRPYAITNVPAGFSLMFVAGALSGLLGIGSGALKVLAMDRAMHVPFKVSTTTSNFMIGVTAAASAGVYLHRGYLDPTLSTPVVLGVMAGAVLGSRLLVVGPVRVLRIVFGLVIVALGLQMIYSGLTGKF
ncbi:MAG TPA: sulfite exporter TauE/SafE family protein [Pirellulales bacterium]|nr:sulfite exporter TauE/SafE family protein [Pirellulales bacterium]